jgi:hypothetical protein
MALDIMGKAHALLEELSESTENDEPSDLPSSPNVLPSPVAQETTDIAP